MYVQRRRNASWVTAQSPYDGHGVFTARSELRKVLFVALSVTFLFACCLCMKYLGNHWRIWAKFTRKTCLVPCSDEFKCQGQRSKVKITRDKFPPHWKCTVTRSLQITSQSSRGDHSVAAGVMGVHSQRTSIFGSNHDMSELGNGWPQPPSNGPNETLGSNRTVWEFFLFLTFEYKSAFPRIGHFGT